MWLGVRAAQSLEVGVVVGGDVMGGGVGLGEVGSATNLVGVGVGLRVVGWVVVFLVGDVVVGEAVGVMGEMVGAKVNPSQCAGVIPHHPCLEQHRPSTQTPLPRSPPPLPHVPPGFTIAASVAFAVVAATTAAAVASVVVVIVVVATTTVTVPPPQLQQLSMATPMPPSPSMPSLEHVAGEL